MSRVIIFLLCTLLPSIAFSQTVTDKLAAAFKTFHTDAQLQNGLASLYVLDAKTGKVVFDANGKIGLAPASTQKIITSISAYELLGTSFRYQTKLAYIPKGAAATLYIFPTGDPTLGSWRWLQTREGAVLKIITQAIKKSGIKNFSSVVLDNSGWNDEAIPDSWIWQDIGNYYGAGASKLNWHENQYDLLLKSGQNLGDPVKAAALKPKLAGYTLRSELTSAAAGTGDNAYIYFPLSGTAGIIRGTIPVNQSSFKISGAMPDPAFQFINTLSDTLAKAGIKLPKKYQPDHTGKSTSEKYTTLITLTSPPLDSLIFWFNRKSINLYGEALLKTMAFQQDKTGTTDKGAAAVRAFWKQKGIASSELNIVDGSGLSPLNRVTAHAQARLLFHARNQAWFPGFYKALPTYNGQKMKSGTIRGVKGFCGYHTSKDGQEYVFAFLVNNFNGPASGVVQKMYKVLDVLK